MFFIVKSAIIDNMVNIGNDWDQILEGEFEKEYYQKLRCFLIKEYKTRTCLLYTSRCV